MFKHQRTQNRSTFYMPTTIRGLMLAVGLSWYALLSTAQAQSRYVITDLGTLGGDSVATDINDRGEVVGFDRVPNNFGIDRAFLYDGGQLRDPGTPDGDASIANGINNRGQVVGEFSPSEDFSPEHAFLYSHGQFVDLIPASPDSSANGINNQGQIVGAFSVSGTTDAFLYTGGQLRDLGTLGGVGSSADGINDRGQVVGESSIAGNSVYHAFIYSAGQMQDLGAFGPNSASNSSVASGINQHGQVIGYGYLQGSSGVFHAFLYTGGLLQDLGTLGGDNSFASGINNRGQVVGGSSIAGNSASHGFIYSGGQMQDLNNLLAPNPGWIVTEAAGINDAGRIAATGRFNGQTHALLLNPVHRNAMIAQPILQKMGSH